MWNGAEIVYSAINGAICALIVIIVFWGCIDAATR
jgi:hypothetical protein